MDDVELVEMVEAFHKAADEKLYMMTRRILICSSLKA